MTDSHDHLGPDLASLSMLELFRMEAENQCAALTADLLALERDPAASDLLESLMRAAHSLKGAARIVDLTPAVHVAHAMEDLLVSAQKGERSLQQEDIDRLLAGVDLLAGCAKVAEQEIVEWWQERRAEVETLVASLAGQGAGPPSAKPETPLPVSEPPPVKEPSPPRAKTKPRPGIEELGGLSVFDLFRAEAESQSAILEAQVQAWRERPEDTSCLEALIRGTHAIKGAARVVDFQGAARVAGALEKAFLACQRSRLPPGPALEGILGSGLRLLAGCSQLPDGSGAAWTAAHQEAVEQLETAVSGLASGQAAVQPAAPAAAPAPEPVQPELVRQPPADKPAPLPVRAGEAAGERALRVSAEAMNRLMGLAGEVLVESRWLPVFSQRMLGIKRRQDEVARLLGLARELALDDASRAQRLRRVDELRRKLDSCRAALHEGLAEIEDHARRSTETSHRLYREVVASRMRPFSEGVQGFPRMVRDVARELGKKVSLDIVGLDTLVDRDILEKIESPLNHLIRNAIDHGLESPEARLAAGKPEEGTIRLEARHSSGMLNIVVADDGRGVDLEGLRSAIVSRGKASAEMAAAMREAELLDFLFLPNFSTKETVSKISGRGVGLDVVHTVVHEVRGVVRASTRFGKGTTFELQLPLTLSVMRALLVEIAGEPYALPLVAIDRILRLPRSELRQVEGRQYFSLLDRRIGLVAGRQVLEKEGEVPEVDELPVIVLSDRFNQYGFLVDRFLRVSDLVVQALDPRLGKIKNISSAALLEDGGPVLIMDVEDVVRSMDLLISGDRLRPITERQHGGRTRRVKRILVADDSITVREVERKLLSAKGYDVDVAVDGMDAWNTVRNGGYDLVVTDVDMPRLDGIELVHLVKKDANLRLLPVIIVSYKDRKEDRQRGLEAGADYYLTKGSFQDETLVQAVETLIGEP
ncbi:MAG: hybrid sensor histidine kinase/response regulator [Thermodesulfobacteriota bacterium]